VCRRAFKNSYEAFSNPSRYDVIEKVGGTFSVVLTDSACQQYRVSDGKWAMLVTMYEFQDMGDS
jgi:hypothetical protein